MWPTLAHVRLRQDCVNAVNIIGPMPQTANRQSPPIFSPDAKSPKTRSSSFSSKSNAADEPGKILFVYFLYFLYTFIYFLYPFYTFCILFTFFVSFLYFLYTFLYTHLCQQRKRMAKSTPIRAWKCNTNIERQRTMNSFQISGSFILW